MSKCPECGNVNSDDAKICVYCGALLSDMTHGRTTRSLDDTDFEEGTPKWGSARFNARTHLILGIEGEPRSLTFDADEIEELVMGRVDPNTGEAPPINLTDYDALSKGVSRKHASIIRKDGSLYLVDHASANGTFLNGQRVVANQSRVLRDGDEVRLGHLVVRISFEQTARQ